MPALLANTLLSVSLHDLHDGPQNSHFHPEPQHSAHNSNGASPQEETITVELVPVQSAALFQYATAVSAMLL